MHPGPRQTNPETLDFSDEDDLSNVNVKSLVSFVGQKLKSVKSQTLSTRARKVAAIFPRRTVGRDPVNRPWLDSIQPVVVRYTKHDRRKFATWLACPVHATGQRGIRLACVHSFFASFFLLRSVIVRARKCGPKWKNRKLDEVFLRFVRDRDRRIATKNVCF